MFKMESVTSDSTRRTEAVQEPPADQLTLDHDIAKNCFPAQTH